MDTNNTPQEDMSTTTVDTVLTVTESAFVRMVFEEYNALMSQAEKHRNARLEALVKDHPVTGTISFRHSSIVLSRLICRCFR